MKRRSLIGLPALVAALFSSSGAFAQAAGFAVDRFDPAERGSDWFVSESLDLRGSARPAFGVVLDWGHKPLVVYDTSGNERSRIIGGSMEGSKKSGFAPLPTSTKERHQRPNRA